MLNKMFIPEMSGPKVATIQDPQKGYNYCPYPWQYCLCSHSVLIISLAIDPFTHKYLSNPQFMSTKCLQLNLCS
uniref:Uncharacterized protein n=1 Tax=Rhizophora mucronata TaxID=61149 RepID=A0A2P2NGW3_RHIMU